MAANTFDTEIRKYLPLLGNEEKRSLLTIIKRFLHLEPNSESKSNQDEKPSRVDYSKYRFPVSDIKFNRDEINER